MSSSGNELSKRDDSSAGEGQSKPEEKSGRKPSPPTTRSRKRNAATLEKKNHAGVSSTSRTKSPAATDGDEKVEDLRFFRADQWTIFGRAHQMVEALVNNEGPYRKKLVDLAQHGIAQYDDFATLKPDDVVAEAWKSVSFLLADPSEDPNLTDDGSCAYTSMGKEGDKHFPIIAISSSFMENDRPAGQRDGPASTMVKTVEDKRTLLLFFRKIKHEFLHVVHRFLELRDKKKFRKICMPDKYTPHKQKPRTKAPAPEVGDHDEEEDSGGPILPLRFNEKLSATNPLCVNLGQKYLPLSEEQVEGLLQLELYSVQVPDLPHVGINFSFHVCRAFQRRVLDVNFFVGDGVSVTDNPASCSSSAARAAGSKKSKRPARSSRSSSPGTYRSSSPAGKGSETEDETDDDMYLAAWRRNGHIAIERYVPASVLLRRRSEQSSSSAGGQ